MIDWISVKDRLPPTNKKVVVWDNKIGVKIDCYWRFDGDSGWAKSNQIGVTHWVDINSFNESVKPNE